ncbi:helix-turn-helix domain-containing protein [Allorhizocola rhizosphaerae]|uniref:helix-turn-helix domain-containing protein n=1 Tax=Allorhizocola rhizosphaerae TaxID=1872709 RepID=UPI0013C2AECF|nr:helix-turn-helix transcriptional regulator [Allorhizocola rhizosphaerae]
MGRVQERRIELGLTQGEAAAKAGVSLATWRRLEGEDGVGSFRTETVTAVERVLRLPLGGLKALAAGEELPAPGLSHQIMGEWFAAAAGWFTGDPMTPRQAFHLSMATAGLEDDAFIGWDDYLLGKSTVSDLLVLSELPDWVLFTVNNHWLQRFREVLLEIGEQLEAGQVPLPRCMADRVALSLLIRHAREAQHDVEEMHIDGDPAVAAALPFMSEEQEDWDALAEALFGGDFDMEMIWLPNFTRALYGDPDGFSAQAGVNISEFHPHRWFETTITL